MYLTKIVASVQVPSRSSSLSLENIDYGDLQDELINIDPMFLMSKKYNRSDSDELFNVQDIFADYFQSIGDTVSQSTPCVETIYSTSGDSDNMFYDVNRLDTDTALINDLGGAISKALDLIEFNSDTCKQKNHGTNCNFQQVKNKVSGNLANFTYEFNSKINEKEEFLGGCTGVYIHIDPISTTVIGLDEVIKESLNQLKQDDYAYANYKLADDSQSYVVDGTPANLTTFSMNSLNASDLEIDVSFDFEMKIYLESAKMGDITLSGKFEISDDDKFSDPAQQLSATLISQMNYGQDKPDMKSMDKYIFTVTEMDPGVEGLWNAYWEEMFFPASKAWDEVTDGLIDKKYNPFNYMDNAITSILEESDDYIRKLVGSIATDQLNSGAVKPDLDSAFEAMYGSAYENPLNAFPGKSWDDDPTCSPTSILTQGLGHVHWHDCS